MKRMVTFGASLFSASQKAYLWIGTVAVLLLFSPSVDSAKIQSKDRDNPTRLTSNVISGTINPDTKGDNYHYSFVAGPGDVTITVTLESGGRVNQIVFDLFDEDAKKIGGNFVTAGGGRSEQVVAHVNVTRRQLVLLRIILQSSFGPGRYRVRLSGAVDFGQESRVLKDRDDDPTASPCFEVQRLESKINPSNAGDPIADAVVAATAAARSRALVPKYFPKEGILSVLMKDGSSKEIDLSQTAWIGIFSR